MSVALYDGMTPIHDYAVQRHALSGGTDRLPFRFSECEISPRSPAPPRGQRNWDVTAGLGHSDAEVDALVRDGVLPAEHTLR